MPVMVDHVRRNLNDARVELEKLCRWIVPTNAEILSHAGLAGNEVRYMGLVGWMLYPDEHPELALRCQREWVRSLGLDVASKISGPAEPSLEVSTDDGRADLVFHFRKPDYLLIVEAKVDAAEHVTPGGEYQTVVYPREVRSALGLAENHPGEIVYLSPDGRKAANENAITATYDGLVAAVTRALDGASLPQDLRWAYAAVITHLLRHVSPGGTDAAADLRTLKRWLDAGSPTDERILLDISTLGPLTRPLASGRRR